MTKDQVKAVLERVPTWPEDWQQELIEVALEIEAELAGTDYDATPDELAAIDEGLAGESYQQGGDKGGFRQLPESMRVEYSKRAIADLDKSPPIMLAPATVPCSGNGGRDRTPCLTTVCAPF